MASTAVISSPTSPRLLDRFHQRPLVASPLFWLVVAMWAAAEIDAVVLLLRPGADLGALGLTAFLAPFGVLNLTLLHGVLARHRGTMNTPDERGLTVGGAIAWRTITATFMGYLALFLALELLRRS